MSDPMLRMLSELPHAEPDPVRADRVRARCHDALARARRRQPAGHAPVRFWEPIVVGLGGIYLTESIREALYMFGVL
jgi:hypothetical protein